MGTNRRAATLGWVLPLALLGLPHCSLYTGGVNGTTENTNPGPFPQSDAIFCDIETKRECATPDEEKRGIRLTGGAVALVAGSSSDVALDYSLKAMTDYNCTVPVAVSFAGRFPDGKPVCLNCGAVIPGIYKSAQAVCEALCADLTDPGVVPPTQATAASCAARTRLSTNASLPACFANACSAPPGDFNMVTFSDPRRFSEFPFLSPSTDVTIDGFNTLKRTTPPPNNTTFDAGASSVETIDSGDGYVQFEATETNTARLGGLKQGGPSFTPAAANIDFAIDLFTDHCFYIYEKGVSVKPTDPEGTASTCTAPNAVGTYMSGDKFRIIVEDNFDGKTGKVYYEHYSGGIVCQDGSRCYYLSRQDSPTPANYSLGLRFDSALREQNATLTNVRLVRNR
jgi:hypothetical protein